MQGKFAFQACKGRTKIFVEVKTRRSRSCGSPQEAVGMRKQRQVIRAAQWYLAESKVENSEVRFDVVAVSLLNGEVSIEHIPAAFEFYEE